MPKRKTPKPKKFLVITDGYERYEQGQRTVEIKGAIDLKALLFEIFVNDPTEEADWEYDLDDLESSNGDGQDYIQIYEMNGDSLECVFGDN